MTQDVASLSLPPNLIEIVLALGLTATLAGVAALAVGRVAQHILSLVGRGAPSVEPLAPGTLKITRALTFVIVFVVLAFPALDLVGVDANMGLNPEDLGQWMTGTGMRIAAILLLAFVVVRLISVVISRAESELTTGTGLDAVERRKRAQTVSSLVRRTLVVLIWITAALMVLRELDVDITPVLAGAGIVGLAVGFGAQTLVRDIIMGFFLIVEDQIRVGDVATVNGIGGLVEQINLRTIVLRDLEGVVHVIPNGEIKTLANRTKDFSFYVIDLGIAYDADLERAVAAVQAAGASLMDDPRFAPSILAPVEILGVDDFKESFLTLKLRIKTVPLKQWEVGRELRRRIKQQLEREGLRIPLRRVDVTLRPGDGAAVDALAWQQGAAHAARPADPESR